MSSFVGLLFVRIHGGNQRMVCTVGHATHARVAHAALYLFHHRCPIGRAQTLVLRRLQMVGARRPCSSVHFGPCRTRRNIFLRTALFGRRFRRDVYCGRRCRPLRSLSRLLFFLHVRRFLSKWRTHVGRVTRCQSPPT